MNLSVIKASMIGRECAVIYWDRMGRKGLLIEWEVSMDRSPHSDTAFLEMKHNGERCGITIHSMDLGLSLDAFSDKYISPALKTLPSWSASESRSKKLRSIKAKARCYGPLRLAA